MAWRKLTLSDVAAHLSQDEMDIFRQSEDFHKGEDPILVLCEEVAAEFRMRLRKNFFVKLSPTVGELPPELISPACDVVVFKILKRFPQEPIEARKLAYNAAYELLKEIQNDECRPESYVPAEGEEEIGVSEEDLRNIPNFVLNLRPALLR